jgi:ribbon-helix-helix protein
MQSTVVKRSVVVGGHKTSVNLENAIWSASETSPPRAKSPCLLCCPRLTRADSQQTCPRRSVCSFFSTIRSEPGGRRTLLSCRELKSTSRTCAPHRPLINLRPSSRSLRGRAVGKGVAQRSRLPKRVSGAEACVGSLLPLRDTRSEAFT